MKQKLKDFWGGLPHQVQGAVVAFGTAALAAFVDAVSSGDYSAAHLKHSAAIAITTGLLSLKAFLSLPSNAQGKLDKQADAKFDAQLDAQNKAAGDK